MRAPSGLSILLYTAIIYVIAAQPAVQAPQVRPVQPVQVQPVQPAQVQPVQPVQVQPVQPAQVQPVQPAQVQPVQPVQAQPVQAAYVQPGQQAAAQGQQQAYVAPPQAAPVPQQQAVPVKQKPVNVVVENQAAPKAAAIPPAPQQPQLNAQRQAVPDPAQIAQQQYMQQQHMQQQQMQQQQIQQQQMQQQQLQQQHLQQQQLQQQQLQQQQLQQQQLQQQQLQQQAQRQLQQQQQQYQNMPPPPMPPQQKIPMPPQIPQQGMHSGVAMQVPQHMNPPAVPNIAKVPHQPGHPLYAAGNASHHAGPVAPHEMDPEQMRQLAAAQGLYPGGNEANAGDTAAQWEALMADFVPDMIVTFKLSGGATEHFHQMVGPEPTLIRGGFFESMTESGSAVSFTVISPTGKIAYISRTGEGVFKFETKEAGQYTFAVHNAGWVGAKYVTFVVGAGVAESLTQEDVESLDGNVKMLYRMLYDMETHASYTWRKMKSHIEGMHSVARNTYYALLIQLAITGLATIAQLNIIKRMVSHRSMF